MFLSPQFYDLYHRKLPADVFPHRELFDATGNKYRPENRQKLDSLLLEETENLRQIRQNAASHLQKQHDAWGKTLAQSAALQNLQNGAPVILTGQQPSVWGGPAFVLFKALSALAHARQLQKSGVDAVAVFWIADDDSDHLEAFSCENPMDGSGFVAHDFAPSGKMLAQMEWSDSLQQQILDFAERSGFAEGAMSVLRRAWEEDAHPGKVLRHILQKALGEEGLLFAHGSDKELRKLVQPMLRGLAEHSAQVQQKLEQQAERVYPPVKGKAGSPVPLEGPRVFMLQDGKRIRFAADHWNRDWELTHDVLSRPLVCDTLFPVHAHVLGPGELRYFALMWPLYEFAGLRFPVLLSRAHLTVHRQECRNILEQSGFTNLLEFASLTPGTIRRKWYEYHHHKTDLSTEWIKEWTEKLHSPGVQTPSDWLKRQGDYLKRKALAWQEKQLWKQSAQARELEQCFRWYGSGRRQERILSVLHLMPQGIVPQNLLHVDFTSPKHQQVLYE